MYMSAECADTVQNSDCENIFIKKKSALVLFDLENKIASFSVNGSRTTKFPTFSRESLTGLFFFL